MQKQLPGRIAVADVAGKVEAVDSAGGSSRGLKKKDIVGEKHTVNVGKASATTLVFSNGSTINLLERSTLSISKFLQNPLSAPFAVHNATGEPTTSTTKLSLIKGEVICKIKKLGIDDGSSFSVNTPIGAAGVRGTSFAVSYSPNQNGTDIGIYTLSVTEGNVTLTYSDGDVILVTAGLEIVVSFRTTVDPLTGETTVVEILNREVRDIPVNRMNRISQVADRGEVDAEMFVFDVGDFDLLDNLQGLDMPSEINNPTPLNEADALDDPQSLSDPNP